MWILDHEVSAQRSHSPSETDHICLLLRCPDHQQGCSLLARHKNGTAAGWWYFCPTPTARPGGKIKVRKKYRIVLCFSALLKPVLSHKTYQCYCLTRHHCEGYISENVFPVDIQNAEWDVHDELFVISTLLLPCTWTYPAMYLKHTFWNSTLPSVQSRSTALISSLTCRTEDHKRVNEERAEGIHKRSSQD